MSLIAIINDNAHTHSMLSTLNRLGYRADLLPTEWYAGKGVLYFNPANRAQPVMHSTIQYLRELEAQGKVAARYNLVTDFEAIKAAAARC